MPITKSDFNAIDKKVITLMGMSGVGKTYLSILMSKNGWHHYSCDFEIGTKYLGQEIEETLGEPNSVTADDLSQLSRYVSRLGNPEEGGLPYDEFKRRQQKYLEAECRSLNELKNIVKQAHAEGIQNVINDSTGSLCEIDDEVLLDNIDENSLIVYIKANAEQEQEVLKRAQEYPKPLFYSPERFDFWVAEFLKEKELSSSDEIDRDEFSRWVFPRLFENRLPKYQAIADKYGVTIPSEEFLDVKNEQDFLDVIVKHLPDEYA
jgi:GTPase SAR1 family protein